MFGDARLLSLDPRVSALIAGVLLAPSLAIGEPRLRIERHTIAGGGGTSSAAALLLRGTIGQWDAVRASSTGGSRTLALTGGFWPRECQPGECNVPRTIRVSSSDPGWAYGGSSALSGSLPTQLAALNSGPPPFDESSWVVIDESPPGVRKNWNGDVLNEGFRCSCDGIIDEDTLAECETFLREPYDQSYVSAIEYMYDVDEVTYDNCSSAFYRWVFDLPEDLFQVAISGWANVDDQGVVFLNGHRLTGAMTIPGFKNCAPDAQCHDLRSCKPCITGMGDPGCMACDPDPNCSFRDACYSSQDSWPGDREDDDPVGARGTSILTWPVAGRFSTSERAHFRPGQNELVFAVAGDAQWLEPTGLEFSAVVYYDPDCNLNDRLDSWDIRDAVSPDYNTNGIPDECEGQDCDGDGISDNVEIATAGSRDDDLNYMPDECEIPGEEKGLIGTYYDDVDSTGLAMARIDPYVNHAWGSEAPWPTFSPESFSVRWEGTVKTTAERGSYTFYTMTDGGESLWIDGQLLIDESEDQSAIEHQQAIQLREDTEYSVVMEYYSVSDNAFARLSWQPPGHEKEIIPEDNLRPFPDCNGDGVTNQLDIARGRSLDCNANGRPDDCDVDSEFKSDCNGNGMPDDCEVEVRNGLIGTYFDGYNHGTGEFIGERRARLDETVDWEWDGRPWPAFAADELGVQWEGRLLTGDNAGSYNFFTLAQDGVWLTVGGFLVIGEWADHAEVTEYSGAIWLDAYTEYLISFEYYDSAGPATAVLSWQPPGETKVVIPSSHLLTGGDCNNNGLPDKCDIESGYSHDCDFSLIPDECENDCNDNGFEDSCDVAEGTSEDCNANGVPDECEGGLGYAEDCNNNGIPDECEIDRVPDPENPDEPERDCNTNRYLDMCELVPQEGLIGTYYDAINFAGKARGRNDASVDFYWGDSAPWYGYGPDTFSIKWVGGLRNLPASGTYTFYTETDAGERLWIDGQLLIDAWFDDDDAEYSATIDLDLSEEHTIEMKYYHSDGPAFARLSWQPPGRSKEIIPLLNLTAGGDCNDNDRPDDCDLAEHPEWDADGDGIIDECVLVDCNGNGIPDYRDIRSGFSSDCNSNGMPDECETALLRVDGFASDSAQEGSTLGGDVIAFTGWGFQSGMKVVFTDGHHRVEPPPEGGVIASDGGERLEVLVPSFAPGCRCGSDQRLPVNIEFDNGCAADDLNRIAERFAYTVFRRLVNPGEDVQAAIAGASEGTCIVLAADANHLGPVRISAPKRQVSLTSAYPDTPGRTQLDGGYTPPPSPHVSDPTVTLDGCDDSVCLSGLNIILGNGGVEIKNSATCIVSGCLIDDNISNSAERGGGVTIRDGATPVLVGNVIAVNTNESTKGGGGVRIDEAGGVLVGNTIQGNKVPKESDGAGMYLSSTFAELVIADNVIHGNQSAFACPALSSPQIEEDYDGGGVYWTGEEDKPGMGVLLRNRIVENTNYKGQGVGLFLDTDVAPTIAGNEIAANRGLTEHSHGGGVLINEFNRNAFDFCNNWVHNNEAHFGGGIVILKKNPVNMFQNLVYCNRSVLRDCDLLYNPPWYAPGVYIDDASPTVTRNVIHGNTGGDPSMRMIQGGGLHCNDLATGDPLFWDNILSENDGWEVYSNLSLAGPLDMPIDWNIGFDASDPEHIFSPESEPGPYCTVEDPLLFSPGCGPADPWMAYSVLDGSPAICTASDECNRGAIQASCPGCAAEPCVPIGPNDCNKNGIPDNADLLAGNSADENLNGVPDECERPGDLNQDGHVDGADFAIFAGCFAGCGTASPPVGCSPTDFGHADVDRDFDVDLGDFAVFIGSFDGGGE